MLNLAETEGLKKLLESISDNEVFSILETVTKRMFKTSDRNEAIERILSCTSKPSDLLRRQKITKKIIFNYLLKIGVPVSAESAKLQLVEKCLKFWDSSDLCNEDDFSEMETEHVPSQQILVMGVAFSKWFFALFNTLNGFGPEHFWPKCSLQAQLHTPVELKEVSVLGSNEVVAFLSNLILYDKFYFHANESGDSIITDEEPHGLVKIAIKGTLHQRENWIGVFDSAFGLIRNPLCDKDTWKIQLVKLKLQANNSPPAVLPLSHPLFSCIK